MGLTPEQVGIIKATVPILAEHGVTITTLFYKNMLAAHPDLNNIFNHTHQVSGHQPKALAMAVYAYAANIDDLGKLSPAVELICHKHASLYIRPEHYGIVGEFLLKAMKEVLGDALTQEIHDAWAAAYWQLADLMIAREEQLYAAADGWTEWRDFRIARRVVESAEITSFYLEPARVNGEEVAPLPAFKPGQYISVRMHVPDLKYLQARQYSLSDAPNGAYYRISVKKERGLDMSDPSAKAHPGYISNILHDEKKDGDVLQVSHPYGDFFFDVEAEEKANPKAPVVLISAGVGLTCLMPILNSLVARKSERPVSWIHAARSKSVRAFAPHIADVVKQNPNVSAVLFSTAPGEDEVEGIDYKHRGRLDLSKLDRSTKLFLDDDRTQYYVCGPTQFMLDVEGKLREFGVPAERVHVELFGTGGVPRV